MTEKEILQFQVVRQLKSLAKNSLILLEDSHAQIQKLEKTLLDMGITKYSESQYNYQKDRKAILDKLGDAEREIMSFINSFDIKLKKD